MSDFYITTPIYYVNAEPHLGHAYSTIVADTARRFHKLIGDHSRMQTGTDEHGDKIAEAATARGIEPKAYADEISGKFQNTWPGLNIKPDNFIRTTDEDHKKLVREILQKVYDAGDIYFASYSGKYCVGCERFITEKELVDGKCPEHDKEPAEITEENYFFRMSKYQDALAAHIEANPEFIRPERYKNEVLAMLKEDLGDLCISRPKTRLTWGIELPFDEKYVTYVWFDALINYLTGLNYPDGELYEKFWPGANHLIAKDILKPHAIFWPTMLLSAGIPLYQHLNVHGYWNVDQAKMSKSLGNVVRPLELAEVYGVDAFRYFLMRDMSFGLDSNFSESLLVDRYNSDLANDLGNLTSRVLKMVENYRGNVLPQAGADEGLKAEAAKSWREYREGMDCFKFHKGLAAAWSLIDKANKFVVASEPWKMIKEEDKAADLDMVLNSLVQALAEVTVMISPVMPETAAKLAEALCLNLDDAGIASKMGSLSLISGGAALTKPENLFPRVDTKKVQAKAAKKEAKAEPKKKKEKKKKAAPTGPAEEISIDRFAEIDLRVGKVLECKKVEKADKLLHFAVDLGEAEPRSIISGIAEYYAPEDLVGKQVVVVANLKPVKLRGILSQGMLLSAEDEQGLKLISTSAEQKPGAKVK